MGSAALGQGWPVAATLGLLAAAACIGVIASEPAARWPQPARVEAPIDGPPPQPAPSFAGAAAGVAGEDDGEEGLAAGWGQEWVPGMSAPLQAGTAQGLAAGLRSGPAAERPLLAHLRAAAGGSARHGAPSGAVAASYALRPKRPGGTWWDDAGRDVAGGAPAHDDERPMDGHWLFSPQSRPGDLLGHPTGRTRQCARVVAGGLGLPPPP